MRWYAAGWTGLPGYGRLNLVLAFVVCGVALVLATPLVSFNAISTRDQVGRLESGKVTPDQFDWRALAFDFGAPGRAALKRLQGSANATIKARANEAARAERRWDVKDNKSAQEAVKQREEIARLTRVLPAGKALPEGLRDLLAVDYPFCLNGKGCTAFFVGDGEALVLRQQCFEAARDKSANRITETCVDPDRYVLKEGKWSAARSSPSSNPDAARRALLDAAFAAGTIEVRTVPRRQTYIGGIPVGEPFE